MKVLVADDSPIYRKMLQVRLEEWQYEVVLAKDGNEALAVLQGPDPPRLAILDGIMPGLTGPEVCKAVRASKSEYIYTILLSANGEESDVALGFEFGADDYLSKPFNAFELSARLRAGKRIIEAQNTLKSKELLRSQNTNDGLTQVWNSGEIMELLEKELNRASRSGMPLSICLADLDHFKLINDNFGHRVGHKVLQEAGSRMANVLRDYDSLGRYKGKEFLAVLPGCTGEDALTIAERLRKSVGNVPLVFSPTTLSVTTSLGVCEWRPKMGIDDLLQQAALALGRAKANGRNRSELGGLQSFPPAIAVEVRKTIVG